MRHNARFDVIFSTTSWLIVLGLLFSAVSQVFITSSGLGPVTQLIGPTGSAIFYGTLYTVQAALLAYSKFRKKKRMRKHVLMFTYLTGFFTTFLTMSVVGLVPKLIDNLLISVASAGCWLYWTFKTEYLDPETFMKDYDDYRRDQQ